MDGSANYPSDVAFSPSVKAVQTRKGSRGFLGRMEENGSWATQISPDLASFIAAQTSVFLATASSDGQPYIQHRGGPPGFLHVLDDKTIAFADFIGNRQFITQGNLAENPKAQLFLIDYAHRRRVKIWGEARVVEDDAASDVEADAAGLQGAIGAGDPVHRCGMGHELSAAYPAALRSRRCRSRACRARCAHRGAGGRGGTSCCEAQGGGMILPSIGRKPP